MRKALFPAYLVFPLILLHACKPEPVNHGTLQIVSVTASGITLQNGTQTADIPVDASFTIVFSDPVDTTTVKGNIHLVSGADEELDGAVGYASGNRDIRVTPAAVLDYSSSYRLEVGSSLKGASGESFPGIGYPFTTAGGKLVLTGIQLNGRPFDGPGPLADVDFHQVRLDASFSDPLNSDTYNQFFVFSGGIPWHGSLSDDGKSVSYAIGSNLESYKRYFVTISSNLTSADGYSFGGFSGSFYTALDSTDKYPRIPDDELLDKIERQTFAYFWEFGHPVCGLARERNTSGDIVTIGGSGFGIMAMIVAMERRFITREQGIARLDTILHFLETCDRYHGAWPHWLNGVTGKTVPFSPIDDGGDLVETSFMIQGLLAMREYLDPAVSEEDSLRTRITRLWETVEWTWFQNGHDVLYWHWSPNYNFNMNMQIRGYNETLITYVLAASSPTFAIPPSAYHNGYASNGAIRNGKQFYGLVLPLGSDYGGPLFFTHYSFLGLDPRNLIDEYASYWEQNVNQSLINMKYCEDNPRGYIGYSADCWGLTASDNQSGYSAHSPTNDLGVITPTAALSSLPYTPEPSMRAIRHFYYRLGDKLWGPYGFYDAFNVTYGWWDDAYLAIDEGPIVCMIENYRTGLLWNLFMKTPEVRSGLTRLGFTY